MHDIKTIRKINAPVNQRNAHLAAVNLLKVMPSGKAVSESQKQAAV